MIFHFKAASSAFGPIITEMTVNLTRSRELGHVTYEIMFIYPFKTWKLFNINLK